MELVLGSMRVWTLTSIFVGLNALTAYSFGVELRARTAPVTDRLRTAAVREL